MYIQGETVEFHAWDMHFVQKFGIMEATDMVLDFRSTHRHPFLYDTYQLAAFFGCSRKELFKRLRHSDQAYTTFLLPKKKGGVRKITAPSACLMRMQRCILERLLKGRPASPYATAYRRGGKLYDNAAAHVGKKYLLKLDVEDFFGSIRFEQVYAAVFNTRHFPRQIGVILTTLCCKDDVLPQGAPTAPALSNLVMRRFDDAIGSWCKKRGIAYTRYCDDLTFSGDVSLYTVYVKAKSMLEEMGFTLNAQKTHFVTGASRQSVTGLTVNDKVSVSADYKRALRQECYYALKFGIADAVRRVQRTEFMQDGVPQEDKYLNHLLGRVCYVLQIEPENVYFKETLKKLHAYKKA